MPKGKFRNFIIVPHHTCFVIKARNGDEALLKYQKLKYRKEGLHAFEVILESEYKARQKK